MQDQPVPAGDNEIACPISFAWVPEAGIKVGCEEGETWKTGTQRLQDQQRVINVAANNADRDAYTTVFFVEFFLQGCEPVAQSPKIIELRLAFRLVGVRLPLAQFVKRS